METCGCILKQLQEASTDIIIVSNEFLFKDDIVAEIDKNLTRGCNVVDVTNLEPMSIIQRMVYGLLEKDRFSITDADHIVFTLLSEYSRGAATIVHMLTLLLKKCDDNRTGFQLAKHQLKLHIGHKKYQDAIRSSNQGLEDEQYKLTSGIGNNEDIDTVLSTSEHSEDLSTRVEMFSTKVENTQCGSTSKSTGGGTSCEYSKHRIAERSSPIDDFICPEAYCGGDESIERHTEQTASDEVMEAKDTSYDDTDTSYDDTDTTLLIDKPDCSHKSLKAEKSGIWSSAFKMVISYVKGSNDKQKPVTDAIKIDEDDLLKVISSEGKAPSLLYLYINDLLRCDDFSLPAQHLLHCLSIVGSIPLPKFYIDELDKLITEAITTKEDQRMQKVRGFVPKPLVNQLEQGGVIRKFPNPLVYHKDFNPQSVDPTIQMLYIPKLICDAIDSEMDTTDKAVSITCVQHAIENILTGKNTLSTIHLHYLLVLCNQLFDVCFAELSTLGDTFITETVKLKLRISQYCKDLRLSS